MSMELRKDLICEYSSMTVVIGKEVTTMKKSLSQTLAKGTVSVLNTVLRSNANSASCILMHQPKAPKELDKYKKMR